MRGCTTGKKSLFFVIAVLVVSLLLSVGCAGGMSRADPPGTSPDEESKEGDEEGEGEDARGDDEPPREDEEEFSLCSNVPILMYHEVGRPWSRYEELFVAEEDFQKQMQYLDENGYSTVTMTRLIQHWRGEADLPDKPVVITFDDGYVGNYENAFFIMQEFDFVGTVYVVEKLVGGRRYLDEEMLAGMVGAGFELGGHSRTHVDLTRVSGSDLRDEVGGVKEWLQDSFGVRVTTFAYPGPRYDEAAVAAVREAGYLTAVTTEPGVACREDSPLALPRLRIDRSDGLQGFASKMKRSSPGD